MQFEHLDESTEVDYYALSVTAALGKLYGRVHLEYLLWLEDSPRLQRLSIVITILLHIVNSDLVCEYL